MEPISAVAALDDPHRAALYHAIRDAREPLTRERAATQVGISRKLAAFHLDRLVDAGLLEVSYARTAEDANAVGRTPKRYRASDVDVAVTIPERRYDLVGEILVDAVASGDRRGDVRAAADQLAYERGRALGAATRAERKLARLGPERGERVLIDVLSELGFEPAAIDGTIVQRNCPFHRLAQREPVLVCGINRAFVSGVLDGLGVSKLEARLAPDEQRCCVVVDRGSIDTP